MLQLFGIYSKHRPKTKDLQPAKNELAAINVKLMGLDLEILLVPAPLLVAMLALITIASWGVHPADVLHEVCGLLTFGVLECHESRIHELAGSKQML